MKATISKLVEEAINHRAIQHPYLNAIENASFPNPEEALKDFAALCKQPHHCP